MNRPVLYDLKDLWQFDESKHLQWLNNKLITLTLDRPLICHGPFGCGKTSIAQIIAYRFGCTQPPEGISAGCGDCEMCRYAVRHDLQIQELYASMSCSVHDRARELRSRLYEIGYGATLWSAVKGNRRGIRVFCLDEAHALSKPRQEELQEILDARRQCLFVFATTDRDALDGLIRSRCIQLPVVRPSEGRCLTRLSELAKANDVPCEDSALREIVADAAWRPRECIDSLYKYAGFATTVTCGLIKEVKAEERRAT